jgi:hypothetical protein
MSDIVKRLRSVTMATLPLEAAAEIERLRAHVVELEAALALARGSLTEGPSGLPDPFTVTWAEPNTPR